MGFALGPAVGGFSSGLVGGLQAGQQFSQNALLQAGQQAWANTLSASAPPVPQAGAIPGGSVAPPPPVQGAAPPIPSMSGAQPGGPNIATAPPPAAPPPQATQPNMMPPPAVQPPQAAAPPPQGTPSGIPSGVASYPMQNRNDPAFRATTGGGAPPRPSQPGPGPQSLGAANPYQGANIGTPPNIPEQYQQGFQVLQRMAQAIKAANPNAPPGVIAAALATGVQQLQPMVRQQAMDTFKYITAGQGQERLQQGQERIDTTRSENAAKDERGNENIALRAKALQAGVDKAQAQMNIAKQRLAQAKSKDETIAAQRDYEDSLRALTVEIAKFNAGTKAQGITPNDETQAAGATMAGDAAKEIVKGTPAKPRNEDSTGPTPPEATDKLRGAMAPPKPGDVVQGYKFKGGDPAQPSNWVPAGGQ